jgi:hypothetical protein
MGTTCANEEFTSPVDERIDPPTSENSEATPVEICSALLGEGMVGSASPNAHRGQRGRVAHLSSRLSRVGAGSGLRRIEEIGNDEFPYRKPTREGQMTRVLLVGQQPETVDFTNPVLPPGMNAERICAGITLALRQWPNADGTRTDAGR